ncbi:ABC transporter substrate-binding protein [Candidatus Trichorickettsia mobilis]|uniref:ABC transporter substrate-binding protein n=1 Tax=Candidatus Trichorickettsia mobilis TaxID=1346319 RepID=UPI00292F008C|nr:ABC transporter substrate-binding protein [Candidatus Trichorickettsia mobilis]
MEQNINNKAAGVIAQIIDHKLQLFSININLLYLLLTSIILAYINPVFAKPHKPQTVIAITEIVQHPALEEAKVGILDILKESGYIEGENLKIIQQNAQGNIANASLIAKNFIHLNPDAIIAISTPSAQSVLNVAKNTKIPIIFSTVTDPVAAGLVHDLSIAEDRITGSMDYPPIPEVIALIKTLMPNIKTLGILYNTGEANSVKTVGLVKAAVNNQWQIIESTTPNSAQVSQALYRLIGKVDAVYLPSDNTVFASMPTIVQIARKHKLPLFSNEPTGVKQGVLACIGYTQYAVGRTAGKLLLKMLNGETKLKVEKPEQTEIFINKTSAEILGIAIPKEMLGHTVQIFGEN